MADASTSTDSTIASFVPAPLNAAANPFMGRPLTAIGLSSASSSSGDVRSAGVPLAAFSFLFDTGPTYPRRVRTLSPGVDTVTLMLRNLPSRFSFVG